MKFPFLSVTFILLFSLHSRGNMDCIWTSSKAGVTIRFVAPCDQKYELFLDSVLNAILKVLNREDTSLQLLILVNDANLSHPNTEFANFMSIGFDTLRQIDDDFISDYYFSRNGAIKRQFSKRFEPIDINATFADTIKLVGIKIIYRRDYRLGEPNWAEIKNLILYSAQNLDLIKKAQSRHNVRYDFNGWFVSLMSIDTSLIRKIAKGSPDNKKELSITQRNSYYHLWAIAGLVLIFTLFLFGKKHSR